MTTFPQFCARAKMRHDYSDMIQVRYPHPNGEKFETWISGEEVMSRLKTASREQLIRSFSRMQWGEAKAALEKEWQQAQDKSYAQFRQRSGDWFGRNFGGHIFGETAADAMRGVDSTIDPRDQEKQQWQARLPDPAFRAIALELAWIDLEGAFPEEPAEAGPDDWV
ncbi:MAG TPA: hypothetical protein PLD25_14710 [Chloroflexota bacterium]|nr:hypothetical protein [Chloroflexota bacterium]HUM67619.1 hypothetical protein [Chloroflexota bacterium]